MHPFPHRYSVAVSGSTEGELTVSAEHLPAFSSAPPLEFGGPGDKWSPETLQVAAVADCFVSTFRGLARASSLPWTSIHCGAVGTLDRVEGVTQFTAFHLHARLRVPALTNADQARNLLEKAERRCLIANSLKAPVHLDVSVDVSPASTTSDVAAA